MLNKEIRKARKRTWKIHQLERDIQLRSKNKDSNFYILKSYKNVYKKYLFPLEEFDIVEVDGEWIRNNLYPWFRVGGHGRVHLFIPNDEIWIEDSGDAEYNARTIIHEIHEFKKMAKLPFYHAHLSALTEEFRHPKKLKKLAKQLEKSLK